MTTYPKTREEYKAAILHNIYRLVQALELDDDRDSPTWTAQSIHHDTREYFNAERWKPRPVNEGIRAKLPVGEVLTFRIQKWTPEAGWAGPKSWTVSSRDSAQIKGTTLAFSSCPGDGLTATFAVGSPQRGSAGRPLACSANSSGVW